MKITQRRGKPVWQLGAGCLLLIQQVCAEVLIREDIIVHPSLPAFSVCQDHSCGTLTTQSISEQEWQTLSRALRVPAPDPSRERQQLARYIAAMETHVGRLTGTSNDLPGVFRGTGQPGQMDCIDEANNTSTYLKLAQSAQLLRWHRVGELSTRGFFLFGWPHTSATLEDKTSGRHYAVDSWFHANGVAPEVVELSRWKQGWSPDEP